MSDRLEVEEIADSAGLEALRADWLALWQRVPAATPFQSPAWLVPWWRVFDDGELMALAVRLDGRLVGLAPLDILHEATTRKLLLPLGIGISDFLDPLLGHLPVDPGTEPPPVRSSEGDPRRPEGRGGGPNLPRSSLARILAYAIVGGAIVLGLEIVVALASAYG